MDSPHLHLPSGANDNTRAQALVNTKTPASKLQSTSDNFEMRQRRKDAFYGANEDNEIETIEEFLLATEGKQPNEIKMNGWILQEVDFSTIPKETFLQYDLNGAWFWGCTFPEGLTEEDVHGKGAVVGSNLPGLPFKMFRGFMYTQKELQAHDTEIYSHYLDHKDLKSLLYQTVHDYFIQDALYDYLEGKTVVGVMGGHGVRRDAQSYRNIAWLGWKLASLGFVVATGGGPGAMEAANLGAYLGNRDEECLNLALEIISSVGNGHTYEHDYDNLEAPKAVIEKFGPPTDMPSLGVPTWKYGHEPSNMFATWQAKMFSNAIREDGLIAIANGGIVYTAGSAGTRQEVFQDACRNHYARDGDESPMIFYDSQFWKKSGVYDVLQMNSAERPFANLMLLTDDPVSIVAQLVDYRESRLLPIVPLTSGEHKSNKTIQSRVEKSRTQGMSKAHNDMKELVGSSLWRTFGESASADKEAQRDMHSRVRRSLENWC